MNILVQVYPLAAHSSNEALLRDEDEANAVHGEVVFVDGLRQFVDLLHFAQPLQNMVRRPLQWIYRNCLFINLFMSGISCLRLFLKQINHTMQ